MTHTTSSVFTPSLVISAIQAGPKDVLEIASTLGLGVKDRDLEVLKELTEELVRTESVRVNPSTGKMEMFTPQTLLETRRLALISPYNFDRVRISLTLGDAYFLRDALETFSRIGIGQVENMVELVRWRAFGPDSIVTADQLDELESLAKQFKLILTGFSSGSSYGIFNPKVPEVFKSTWTFYRHIRHRLAWDQTPSSGIGVHFDEVMAYGEKDMDVFVTSDSIPRVVSEPLNVLRMEFDLPELETLIQALDIQSNLVMASFAPVVDLLIKTKFPAHDGSPSLNDRAPAALAIAQQMRKLLDERYFVDENIVNEAGRLSSMATFLRAVLEGKMRSDVEMVGANDLTAVVNPTSALGFKKVDLPVGCDLIGYAGEYGVLAPDDGKAQRLVIARSQSLQTAVLMAINKMSGETSRGMAF